MYVELRRYQDNRNTPRVQAISQLKNVQAY
jgi:hypothetical protein